MDPENGALISHHSDRGKGLTAALHQEVPAKESYRSASLQEASVTYSVIYFDNYESNLYLECRT